MINEYSCKVKRGAPAVAIRFRNPSYEKSWVLMVDSMCAKLDDSLF